MIRTEQMAAKLFLQLGDIDACHAITLRAAFFAGAADRRAFVVSVGIEFTAATLGFIADGMHEPDAMFSIGFDDKLFAVALGLNRFHINNSILDVTRGQHGRLLQAVGEYINRLEIAA